MYRNHVREQSQKTLCTFSHLYTLKRRSGEDPLSLQVFVELLLFSSSKCSLFCFIGWKIKYESHSILSFGVLVFDHIRFQGLLFVRGFPQLRSISGWHVHNDGRGSTLRRRRTLSGRGRPALNNNGRRIVGR